MPIIWRDLKINSYVLCAFLLLTFLAITFVDQPLALWIHQNNLDQMLWLAHFTENSAQLFAIFAIILIAIGKDGFNLRQKFLLTVGIAVLLIVALYCKTELKYIFARNWPLYWLNIWAAASSPYGNSYGFHLNHVLQWQGSMPSGHTSFIGTLGFMLWYIYPNSRLTIAAYLIAVVLAIITLNYHFLGDCLAGFVIAALINMLFICYYHLVLKN